MRRRRRGTGVRGGGYNFATSHVLNTRKHCPLCVKRHPLLNSLEEHNVDGFPVPFLIYKVCGHVCTVTITANDLFIIENLPDGFRPRLKFRLHHSPVMIFIFFNPV